MKKIITQNCKGQAIVETALVLMLIVMFTFAITEFGRAMYIKNMLNNTARAAARQAVVTGTLTIPVTYGQGTFTSCTTPSTDKIKDKICDSLMYVGTKSTISAQVECVEGCPSTTATTGSTIRVTVTENNFTPVVSNVPGIVITKTLVGQASMRYE